MLALFQYSLPRRSRSSRFAVIATVLLASSAGSLWASGYSYFRTLTVDHTKVLNTDQVNFPVLVSLTSTSLATTGNGGHVMSANGFDIIFTSDAACATKLNHEVETWSGTTGQLIAWVQVPTVSQNADTTIYLCYGNNQVTTDQSNKTGVWDSNYIVVNHFANGTMLSAADSTSNGNNGALVDGPTATTGQMTAAWPSAIWRAIPPTTLSACPTLRQPECPPRPAR